MGKKRLMPWESGQMTQIVYHKKCHAGTSTIEKDKEATERNQLRDDTNEHSMFSSIQDNLGFQEQDTSRSLDIDIWTGIPETTKT